MTTTQKAVKFYYPPNSELFEVAAALNTTAPGLVKRIINQVIAEGYLAKLVENQKIAP